jgi:5-enolpyruvylshikimate-3-phosphate synthase
VVQGGVVDSRGDHRIAMAFAVLAACATAPVRVRDVQTVATSFPGFADVARTAGLVLAEEG